LNSEFDKLSKMRQRFFDKENRELRKYREELYILKNIFPRGRFRMWEDGKCALIALNKNLSGCAIFVHGEDKLSLKYGRRSLFYLKSPMI